MKINKSNNIFKCDIVGCNKNSTFEIKTGSYKGDLFMCENCFKQLRNLLKKESTNESKK